jgi:hypothetical protein
VSLLALCTFVDFSDLKRKWKENRIYLKAMPKKPYINEALESER